MIRHSMSIIQQNFDYRNQLSTIVQNSQADTIWNWPDTYGEDRFGIMLGSLHIEMTLFKTLGGWLEDSG
jgi:hypothetical protein